MLSSITHKPQFTAAVVGAKGGVNFSEIEATRINVDPQILAVYPKVHALDIAVRRFNILDRAQERAQHKHFVLYKFDHMRETLKATSSDHITKNLVDSTIDNPQERSEQLALKSSETLRRTSREDDKVRSAGKPAVNNTMEMAKLTSGHVKATEMLETPKANCTVELNSENQLDATMDNQQGLVKCVICGKLAVSLQSHVTTHGLSPKQYKTTYNASLVGKAHRKITERSLQTRKKRYGDYISPVSRKNAKIKINQLIAAGTFSLQVPANLKKAHAIMHVKLGGQNAMQIPAIAAKNHSHRHSEPNKYERWVLANFSELKFVGNFKLKVQHSVSGRVKYPDFVFGNAILEVFGDFWHSRKFKGEDRPTHENTVRAFYADCGYTCLIVWASEIQRNPEVTKQKITSFLRDYQVAAGKTGDCIVQPPLAGLEQLKLEDDNFFTAIRNANLSGSDIVNNNQINPAVTSAAGLSLASLADGFALVSQFDIPVANVVLHALQTRDIRVWTNRQFDPVNILAAAPSNRSMRTKLFRKNSHVDNSEERLTGEPARIRRDYTLCHPNRVDDIVRSAQRCAEVGRNAQPGVSAKT